MIQPKKTIQTNQSRDLFVVGERAGGEELDQAGLFAIFPGNFALETLGSGFPTVILQNTSANPNGTLLFLSAFASVGLAATALWWTTQSLLAAQRQPVRQRAGLPPLRSHVQ